MVRALAVLVENLSSVLISHIRQLTTTCNEGGDTVRKIQNRESSVGQMELNFS